MSTLGTLSYYADTHITHETDDHLASRYSSGAALHQTRELALPEYGDQDPCPFQTKSALFGAPWSPVPDAAIRASSSAYHPYAHQPCPAGESDAMALRAWTLEPPVSAPLTYSGLATNVHHEIKPEPLSGGNGCITLVPPTLVADIDEDSCVPEKETARTEPGFPRSTGEKSASANKKNSNIDPSESRTQPRDPKAITNYIHIYINIIYIYMPPIHTTNITAM